MVCLALLVLFAAPSGDVEAFPDARATLEGPVVADPDEPRFSYGTIGARSRSSFGGRLGLVGFEPGEHQVVLSLAPFLELTNISGQPISWQSFRANVGLDVSWRPPLAESRGLVVHTGYFHESDHVADTEVYEATFLEARTEPFDNGNFSSFEYIKVRADFWQRWRYAAPPVLTLIASPGLRLFTPNINTNDTRGDVAALQGEVRFDVAWRPQISTWVAAYGELGLRHFNDAASYQQVHSGPAVTRRVLLGLTAQHRSPARFVFQVGYDNSNGRGVDFMRGWGHAFTVELGFYR